MKWLLFLAFLLVQQSAAPAWQGNRARFLLSLTVELRPRERVDAFRIETWGPRFLAVCNVPPGWLIRAGGSAAPDGTLEGEGTHGVTWIGAEDMDQLNALALIELQGPIDWQEVHSAQPGARPATFTGTIGLFTVPEHRREVRLQPSNLQLTPAEACPPPRPRR